MNYDNGGNILAPQDEGLLTNAFEKIFKLTTNNKGRFHHVSVETVKHLLSGCPKLLAEGRYTTRHNNVCRVIHCRLCQEYIFQIQSGSWKHNLQPLLEIQDVRITYDTIVRASRHVTDSTGTPDTVVMKKMSGKVYIIDVCVPNDYGMGTQKREQVVKYQYLKNHIADTYNLQPVEIIPVVIRATVLMRTNLKKKIYTTSILTYNLRHSVKLCTNDMEPRKLRFCDPP